MEYRYNENLTNYLRKANAKEAKKHERSGKISPTKLTKPTLEAVLSMLGVPQDPPSNQSLRYFIRGTTLEEIACKALTRGRTPLKLQVAIEYKGGIGYADAFTKVPHEIKSAGTYTWRRVLKERKPLHHHAIQATYYALGAGTNYSWVHYINAETFELISFRAKVIDYKQETDNRIRLINDALLHRSLPDYLPLEDFHKSIRYTDYSLFFNKKGEEAEQILKQYYDSQYEALKSGALIRVSQWI